MFDFTEYKHASYMLTLLDNGDDIGKLRKVRVNIIDKNTGECVEEVDVLTSADAVIFDNNRTLPQELRYQLTYTNSKGTTADVGGIKKGTTFVDVPFKDIFAAMLYPEADATAALSANVDTSATYQQGNNISPITFTLDISIGTNQIKSAKLFRDGREEGTFKNFPANGGTGYYSYTGEVSSTTTFFARIEDTKGGIVETDSITVKFHQPIYIGKMDGLDDVSESIIKGLPSYLDYFSLDGMTYIFSKPIDIDEELIVLAYPAYADNNETVKIIDDRNKLDITNLFERSTVSITDAGQNLVNYVVMKAAHITTQTGCEIRLEITHV